MVCFLYSNRMDFRKALKKDKVAIRDPPNDTLKTKLNDSIYTDFEKATKLSKKKTIKIEKPEGVKSATKPIDRLPPINKDEPVVKNPDEGKAVKTIPVDTVEQIANATNTGLGATFTPMMADQKEDITAYFNSLKKAPIIQYLPQKGGDLASFKGNAKIPDEGVSGKAPVYLSDFQQRLGIY